MDKLKKGQRIVIIAEGDYYTAIVDEVVSDSMALVSYFGKEGELVQSYGVPEK